MFDSTNFSYQIKELRKEKNMSQEELGKRVGKSKVAICNYENGINFPSLDTLIALAKALDCSVDYLLGVEYDELEQLRRDEYILKSIKRNNTVYEYLLQDTRNNVKKIEEIIKNQK